MFPISLSVNTRDYYDILLLLLLLLLLKRNTMHVSLDYLCISPLLMLVIN